jgi:alcohol dehydrogenase (cytochrome c)
MSWVSSRRRIVTVLAAALLACLFGANAYAADEWVTVNKDYSSQRYVDLDEITPANVSGLKELCELQLNEPSWFSSGLLMVGRTLYASTLRATYAVDAASCQLRWRSVLEVGRPANVSSRGPAYLDGTIFRGTVDGRVIALDAETGKVVWDQQLADPKKGESFVAAPIAWNGKVFIGIAISDLGIRGRMMALDAKTGQELWRFYTVPTSITPGVPSWGGGGFWSTFSLDPVTGEVFGPVANPAPDFDTAVRPGDNLYTNSVIALDAASGRLNWYYQVTPRDDHDWDYGTAPTLYRTRAGREMVAAAGKNGYVLGLDRATRAVVFNTPAEPVSNNGPITWEAPQRVCPGLGGGAQYNGAAYNPELSALYVGMVDWCSYYAKPHPPAADSNQAASQQAKGPLDYTYEGAVVADYGVRPKGWITALDGESGRVQWKYQTDAQMLAGLVPTKSGLLFAGDVGGNLFAFDARIGSVLTRIDAGGALNNGLISYALDGRQYVAAAVGGATLNSAGVSGPLKVSIFALQTSDLPKVLKLDRLPAQTTGDAANVETFTRICAPCHGDRGQGRTYPSLTAYPELADPARLGRFLASVPPPMPRLFPGLLNSDDVRRIAAYIQIITGGPSPQWQSIYSVLSDPICTNCHTSTDYPRQTTDRRRHLWGVVRGPDDRGAATLRCSTCHGNENNQVTGVPGAPGWHIAPLSMSWELAPGVTMSGPVLCKMLQDKTRNGNRDLDQLEEHLQNDALVNWAWNPGIRPNGENRLTPSLSHESFVKVFKEWVDAGAPCPAQ